MTLTSSVGVVTVSEVVYNSTMDIGPRVTENTVVVTASLNIGTAVAITYEYTWIDGTVIGKQINEKMQVIIIIMVISSTQKR